LYKTPLGEMPGAMIILNAIKSLHQYGLWVDFAAPLLGMQFHQLVNELKENAATHQNVKKMISDQK